MSEPTVPRGVLLVDLEPAPEGVSDATWRGAQLSEYARLLTLYRNAHPSDNNRIMELAEASHERIGEITSEQSELANARLIVLEVADDLAFDAAMVASGEDPTWESDADTGHVMDSIARKYRLTEKEASTVELAAKVLLTLLRVPYRKTPAMELREASRAKEANNVAG